MRRPRIGGRPVRSVKSTRAEAVDVRAVVDRPPASGRLLGGHEGAVPSTSAVQGVSSVSERARPKSVTLIWPRSSSRRLAGLRSQWTIPIACACSTASHVSMTQRMASARATSVTAYLGEVGAGHEVHDDEVRAPGVRPSALRSHDIRMAQLRDRRRLGDEATDHLGMGAGASSEGTSRRLRGGCRLGGPRKPSPSSPAPDEPSQQEPLMRAGPSGRDFAGSWRGASGGAVRRAEISSRRARRRPGVAPSESGLAVLEIGRGTLHVKADPPALLTRYSSPMSSSGSRSSEVSSGNSSTYSSSVTRLWSRDSASNIRGRCRSARGASVRRGSGVAKRITQRNPSRHEASRCQGVLEPEHALFEFRVMHQPSRPLKCSRIWAIARRTDRSERPVSPRSPSVASLGAGVQNPTSKGSRWASTRSTSSARAAASSGVGHGGGPKGFASWI